MLKALHPRNDIDCMCQEKKEDEDSLALKIALTIDTTTRRIHKKRSKERKIKRTRNIKDNIRINPTTISREEK